MSTPDELEELWKLVGELQDLSDRVVRAADAAKKALDPELGESMLEGGRDDA